MHRTLPASYAARSGLRVFARRFAKTDTEHPFIYPDEVIGSIQSRGAFLELQELRRRLLLAADRLKELDDALVSKGFGAHRTKRDWYAKEARSEQERTNLLRYWTETAREVLGGAGSGFDPIRRDLPLGALYRSDFLDELYALQSSSRDFTRYDGLVLDIEPCHGRIHERIRNGFLPPPGYEAVKNQVRQESESGKAIFDMYLGSPKVGEEFRELLSDVAARQASFDAGWRHRANFHSLERPIRTLSETSAYLCHESDRSVSVGQLAFSVVFARHGTKIVLNQPAEAGREARLAFECFLPEFDAYRNFSGTAEQARCVAAYLIAARLFFDLVDESCT
jgi:hypothetical protein